MNKMKLVLLASAAAMLMGTGEASARVNFYAGSAPSLCLPRQVVATGQALSPYAVATRLKARHFRVQAMYRRGSAYAVKAIGPRGNTVEMMVDGGSGTIMGLAVLQAVAGSIVSALTAQNAVYVDDAHPFGAVVPEVVYGGWQSYASSQWDVSSSETVSVERTFTGFRSAVPFNFMHFNARSGRSYAIAPPKYRGYRLTNSSGQAISGAETRAQMANEEAAYQSERADQSDFDKQMAQEDAADANEHADQLQQQNDALSDVADRESQRANDAEAKNAQLQQQLDQQGTENQDVADDSDTSDNGSSAVDSNDNGGSGDAADSADTQTASPADQGGSGDAADSADTQAASPADNGGADQQAVAPADQGGDSNVPQNFSTGADQQQAAPQDQGGADQQAAAPADQGGDSNVPQNFSTGADQQQAAPQDQGGADQQEQAAPQDQGGGDQQQSDQGGGGGDDQQQMDQGGGGSDMGGGGDSGGGGGDDSGGGGDDGN